MKKTISVVLAVACIALTGCDNSARNTDRSLPIEKVEVVEVESDPATRTNTVFESHSEYIIATLDSATHKPATSHTTYHTQYNFFRKKFERKSRTSHTYEASRATFTWPDHNLNLEARDHNLCRPLLQVPVGTKIGLTCTITERLVSVGTNLIQRSISGVSIQKAEPLL